MRIVTVALSGLLLATPALAQSTGYSTGSNFSNFGSSGSSSSRSSSSRSGLGSSSNSRAYRTGGGTGSAFGGSASRGGVGTSVSFSGSGRKSTIDWSAVAPGQILYRWFDEAGNVHYGAYDDAPKEEILAGPPGVDVRKQLLEDFYGDAGPPRSLLHIAKDDSGRKAGAERGATPPGEDDDGDEAETPAAAVPAASEAPAPAAGKLYDPED